EVDAVLETDADVAAHDRAGRDQPGLVPSGAENRPDIAIAEEAVRGPLHVHEVLDVGADAAVDAEDRLDEQRRLDHPVREEVREVVEVPDVVALELEARAVPAHLRD